jgi:predicted transcriptional regulator
MLFQELVQKIRKKTALTQQELSVEVHVAQTLISFYERGERNPGLRTLRKMVDFAKSNGIAVEYSDIEH